MISSGARATTQTQAATIVWVLPALSDPGATVECVDRETALRRAACAAPRSFSMMLSATALAEPLDPETLAAVRRAHRIVICDTDPPAALTRLLSRARIGLLPPPFDVEAFASALDWLAAA